MGEAELRNMIMNFRVSDLQVLLGFAGRNKTGKKQELQSRALDLLKIKSVAAERKIRELDNRRYHNQLIARPANYELRERSMNEQSNSLYEPYSNSSYNTHCNTGIRPPTVAHTSNSNFSSSKTYIPPPLTNSINHSIPIYMKPADVKFRDLPFYDVLYVLLRPSSLLPEASERYQESTFHFSLTSQQANELAISRGANGSYECQILLRFCLLDNSCEQEDNFPPSISVKVNQKAVQLPNPIPTNRPGVEPKRPSKPVNVTSFTKLSPIVRNSVTLSWSSTYGRSYAVAMYVVRQLTSQTLLQRLRKNGIRNPELTTIMIQEKLQQDQDADIATTNLRISLVCPLGKVRMDLPCRAITCSHIQCFDAFLYIQMNEKKSKWICPVCDKPALFRALIIDGLFVDIASKVPSDCTEVEFDENGLWTPIIPVKQPKEVKNDVSKKMSSPIEVVDVDSESDSDEVWPYNTIPLISNPNCTSESCESTTPPLTHRFPQNNIISYLPNESLNLPSDCQNDSVCILPDINATSLEDAITAVPSSSGLNLSAFPHLSYASEAFSSQLNSYPDQASVSGIMANPYNNMDFSSFINIPDIEPSKPKDYDSLSSLNVVPDIISLE